MSPRQLHFYMTCSVQVKEEDATPVAVLLQIMFLS